MSAAEPIIVVATRAEAPGAALRVAGLTVVDRLIKQLARKGPVRVVTDGEVALPARLPAGTVVERGEAPAGAIAANVVYPTNDLATAVVVTDEASRRGAEDAIFAALLRGDLGPVARWLNKPISFRLTRYLFCRLPFTPNQLSVLAGLVGLAGCALIAAGGWASMALGFLLAHTQSVLDGCDGELARVRFQTSKIGEWLDTVIDDLLNVGLVTATGVGLWRTSGHAAWWVLGVAGGLMFATYSAVAYRTLRAQGAGGELLKIRWWFNRGRESKALASANLWSPGALVYAAGRRDLFCFAWFLLAAVGLAPIILGWALAMASANFFVAIGQLVVRVPTPAAEASRAQERAS